MKVNTPRGTMAISEIREIARNCNYAYELYRRLGYGNGKNPNAKTVCWVKALIPREYSGILKRSRSNR